MKTHTEPVSLESGMKIEVYLGDWTITVGGAQQPQWKATGGSLEECIGDLITKVTQVAIEDEALEWKENGEP